jgi:hypothetical protein
MSSCGLAHRVERHVARREAQAHGARAHEVDRERQCGVAVVLGTGKLARRRARQPRVELREVEARLPHVPLPLQPATTRRHIERRHSAADEVELVETVEVLAHVDRIAEQRLRAGAAVGQRSRQDGGQGDVGASEPHQGHARAFGYIMSMRGRHFHLITVTGGYDAHAMDMMCPTLVHSPALVRIANSSSLCRARDVHPQISADC